MWIFLALAVVCIGAAVGVTVVRKKKENGMMPRIPTGGKHEQTKSLL